MNKDYEKFMSCIDKSYALASALILFNWDSSTEAPSGAVEQTAKYVGILNEIYYHTFVNDEMMSLIDKLVQLMTLQMFKSGL